MPRNNSVGLGTRGVQHTTSHKAMEQQATTVLSQASAHVKAGIYAVHVLTSIGGARPGDYDNEG